MAKIPLNLINKNIDMLGELVTLTVKSDRTYSDWGDETATQTATESIKAVFNVYGNESKYNTEGNFQDGDVTFFFKSGQSGITNGTVVTRSNGDRYEIYDSLAHGAYGSIYVNEAKVKRV